MVGMNSRCLFLDVAPQQVTPRREFSLLLGRRLGD